MNRRCGGNYGVNWYRRVDRIFMSMILNGEEWRKDWISI